MEIKRDRYLNQLISSMWDGQIKVVTGIRRCGKSFLLQTLFRNYLRSQGVQDGEILSFELDLAREIDFVATRRTSRVYIQSAYALHDEAKAETENRPFSLTQDTFRKIIVRHDIRKRWQDERGIINIGVVDFLLDPEIA